MSRLDHILLRDYRPLQQLFVVEHDVRRASTPAIDSHSHLGRWLSGWVGQEGQWMTGDVGAWLETMAGYGMHGFVNLDGRWGEELTANLDRFDNAFPGRFATFAHLDWSVLSTGTTDADALARQVRDAAGAGAAGLKVWKDLGLEVRDRSGELVLPDDPRVEGVWATAGELGLPVWWHVADPVAFFAPVDARNESLELLVERPDWSFHDDGFPSFERLMESLEAVVAAHPSTTFVALHGGCFPEIWAG